MATLQSLRGDDRYMQCNFYEFANVLEELLEQNEWINPESPQMCHEWLERLQDYAAACGRGVESLARLREPALIDGMKVIGKRIADGTA